MLKHTRTHTADVSNEKLRLSKYLAEVCSKLKINNPFANNKATKVVTTNHNLPDDDE